MNTQAPTLPRLLAPPTDAIRPPAPLARGLNLVDQLLRDRHSLLAGIERGEALIETARTLVLTVAVSAAIFGAILGAYRGGLQMLYAGIKLPLVVLLTAAICTPTYTALSRVLRGPGDPRRDLALVLSALALASLLLTAFAPLLLLAMSWGTGYHALFLLVVVCGGAAAMGGLSLFGAALKNGPVAGRRTLTLVMLVVVTAVGAQLTWSLRPYLVRPRTETVPFVRDVEGSLLEAVVTSTRSARGIYQRDLAPLPDARRGPQP